MFKRLVTLCMMGTLLQAADFQKEISICSPSDYQDVNNTTTDTPEKNRPWYGIVGTGYAWSTNTGIRNPDADFWDDSIQGYNSALGTSQFFTFGFGKQLSKYAFVDMSYTYYQTFHYKKFQTGENTAAPAFASRNRTRFFDLDNQNILFNLSIYQNKYFAWNTICLEFSPFVGAGIGVGLNRVTNFHTVTASGATTAIGSSSSNNSFAWQVFGGIRIRPMGSCISFDLGYHYYNAGSFKGPNRVYINEPPFFGTSVAAKAWKGKLKTNQVNAAFNIPF